MTREEALKYANTKSRKRGDTLIYAQEVDVLIELIYDDFESRTCGNCIYNNDLCTYQESIKVYCKVTRGDDYICDFDDFGCNRFERK